MLGKRIKRKTRQDAILTTMRISIMMGMLLSFIPCSLAQEINFAAIAKIESNHNPLAFNRQSQCYGLYQISLICLKEYNQTFKTNYQPRNLFDQKLNEKIARWYFRRIKQMLTSYKIKISIVTVLAAYNWGIGKLKRWYQQGGRFLSLPKATQRYIRRYLLLQKSRITSH